MEPPALGSAVWFIVQGTWMTLALSATVLVVALPLSAAVAVLMSARMTFPRLALTLVSGLVRGVPPLVLLFIAYFVLPAAGVVLSPFTASVVALCLYVVFYLAECIRAGIESVVPGQHDAITALGIGPVRAFVRIKLPQILSVALPPGLGYITEIVKSSALASTISVVELTARGYQMIMATGRPFLMLAVVGAIYLALDLAIVGVQPSIERLCGIRAPRRTRLAHRAAR